MLSVLLKILAVLGIMILILLGIVLFLLLIVLFVPITYRITGQIEDDKKEAAVKVGWLFGILRFTLDYSGSLSWQLKLLWIDLKGLIQKKPKGSSSPETNLSNSQASDQQTVSESAAIEKAVEVTEETPPEQEPLKGNALEETTKRESAEGEEQPKKTISEKVNDLVFKIQSICDKIKEIWGNISYYIKLLREDDTKHLISHCLKVIGNILKSIRPRKLKINAVIGFDSPDTTGKIYGLLCMLYPYYGNDIHITPDFENKIMEGTVFCRGRIYICVLLLNALRILLDRKFFKVIHKLKNGGKRKNGR